MTCQVEIGGDHFSLRENSVVDLGWKRLYQDSDDQIKVPSVKEGDVLDVAVKLTEGKTTAPPPFTEGTLLQAMENPAKYIDTGSRAQTQTLKETGGLGTVATRADIIDKLFNTHYLEARGKYIHTTSKGRQVLELVDRKSTRLNSSHVAISY